MNEKIAIYQLSKCNAYLITKMFPASNVIIAEPRDHAWRVLRLIPPTIKHFFFHLDITVSSRIPLDRFRLLHALDSRRIMTWNAHPINIGKRFLQTLLLKHGLNSVAVTQCSSYEGPVIVKNNANFGGATERVMSSRLRNDLGLRGICKRELSADKYYVCSKNDVPEEQWKRSDIAIEKYVSNSADLFYRAYICGRALVVSRVYDKSLLKKMPPGIARQNVMLWRTASSERIIAADFDDWADIARQARGAAAAMELDFGALDIVCDDGGCAFVVDVNTTPFWGETGRPEIVAFLRVGAYAPN